MYEIVAVLGLTQDIFLGLGGEEEGFEQAPKARAFNGVWGKKTLKFRNSGCVKTRSLHLNLSCQRV